VRQHFRRWARSDVGRYLFLLGPCRHGNVGSSAPMNRIQNFGQASLVAFDCQQPILE
jgi:hypothetical protein